MQNELITTATNSTTPRFPLGQMVMTQGAATALDEAEQSPFEFLSRHQRGDWGDLGEADKRENELSIKKGFRILSKYHTSEGEALYIITESDRSATTILRPDEY